MSLFSVSLFVSWMEFDTQRNKQQAYTYFNNSGDFEAVFFHQRSISNNFSQKAHRSQIFTSNIPDFILICNFIFDVVFCRC